MTAPHTPGPWALRALERRIEVFPVNECGLRPTLASVEKWPREGVNESQANARLIAAAPDLLEALYQILELPEDSRIAYKIARRAIAKATGGSL